MPKAPKLTDKQRAFCEAYLKSFNATKAAKEAGYSEHTAGAIGAENLTKPAIKAYVHARMEKAAMQADEVLFHLAQIARGDVDDLVNEYGNLDIDKARSNGKTNLIKKIRNRQVTTENSTTYETETEGYDRMRALELIGKNLAIWTERLQIDGMGLKQLELLLQLAQQKNITPRDMFEAMIQQFAELPSADNER